jgi:hypothetical protein
MKYDYNQEIERLEKSYQQSLELVKNQGSSVLVMLNY